jgi:hypothetical protein
VKALLAGVWPGGSGPAVARLFQRLFALVFLIAWISLAAQVRLLIGERGLMPLWSFLDGIGAERLGFFDYPSLLRWQATATDGVILGGTFAGMALALLALGGVQARLCFGLSTGLYLSYVVACRDFLGFQWDNLLLECGLLAVFLPAHRPAPVAHLLFRLVAWKLYFESGIAKWESPLHDWHDGTAMTYYYETAPLPAGLAWFAHNLPAWWHHFESRATLVLELLLPFGIFGPRRVRLGTAAAFTGFQVVNAATANYGFFCYLAVALHVFLLDDADLRRVVALETRLRERLREKLSRLLRGRTPAAAAAAAEPRWRRPLALIGLAVWCHLSVLDAFVHFGGSGAWRVALRPLRERTEPLRLVNTYHLFASITRERIEPQFEAQVDGQWRPLHMRHKPGDPARRPGYVAPHQPRVDFLLWFHGLSFQRGRPLYVHMLQERLCRDPAAVASLFRDRPPRAPEAVRISYVQYRFTDRAEHRATGAWWKTTVLDTTRPIPCDR